MKSLSETVIPVLASAVWISILEFIRNEWLFRHYWVEHYESLGMVFPSDPVNGAVWGFWSLCLAIAIYALSGRFNLAKTTLIAWFMAFVMMWLVIGNMGVLPYELLIFAVPLSLLEVSVAAWIIVKLTNKGM